VSHLASSDVLVQYTKIGEAFGRVVAEAQAMGVVPVVSASGALPELVTDHVDGFVCRTESELSEKMFLLSKDNHLRQRMAAAAMKTAKRYKAKSHAEAVMRVYEQALSIYP
jgi:glycosyltransferase involved in cell wall biosynthesis